MFTGIIEELGRIEQLLPAPDHGTTRLRVRSPHVLTGTSLGDSIAVNGCCLTVSAIDGEVWSADVISTTLAATTLGGLEVGDPVNLERSLRAETRLDGHIVQGHIDGVGRVLAREEQGGTTLLRLELPVTDQDPRGLARYVVEKGSLAVDGVSLTVAALEDRVVTIGLIPETLSRTALGTRGPGDPVNLEVDVLAKYVEKLAAGLLPVEEVAR